MVDVEVLPQGQPRRSISRRASTRDSSASLTQYTALGAQAKARAKTIAIESRKRPDGSCIKVRFSEVVPVELENPWKENTAVTKLLQENEFDEKFGLPDTWARHQQKRTKQDNCEVCETPFSMVAIFGIGNRDFFCKQCGYAVCGACSRNNKYLSKDAKEKYRVCDLCDTKLDNIKLRMLFDRMQVLKDQKI